MRPVVLCCVLAACVAPLDDDTGDPLASTESAIWDGGDYDEDGEVVVIEGSIDACWDAGLCWVGVGGEDPTDPGDTGGYGGGGGGPGGGPGDQPERKECSRDQGLDQCLDCCYYNHDKVDGWVCWEDGCQVEDCGRERPIITAGELP